MIGRDGTHGQTGERGQLFGERGRARFQVQAFQLELRSGQLRLQQLAERIDAGLRALLLNLHQTRRILFLLACGFQFAIDRVELDVGRGGVERHLLARILERQLRRLARPPAPPGYSGSAAC